MLNNSEDVKVGGDGFEEWWKTELRPTMGHSESEHNKSRFKAAWTAALSSRPVLSVGAEVELQGPTENLWDSRTRLAGQLRAALSSLAELKDEQVRRDAHDAYMLTNSCTTLDQMTMPLDEMKAEDIIDWREFGENCKCHVCQTTAYMLRLLARAEKAEGELAEYQALVVERVIALGVTPMGEGNDRVNERAEAAEAALSSAKAENEQWVEREAACCPEDVPFDQHISDLRKSLSSAHTKGKVEGLREAAEAVGGISAYVTGRNGLSGFNIAVDKSKSAILALIPGEKP